MGEVVEVLVETVHADGTVEGRTAGQAPDVDGSTTLLGVPDVPAPAVGDLVRAVVVGSEGVDLVARPARLPVLPAVVGA